MDPVVVIVVPGLIGGVAIALFMALHRSRGSKRTSGRFEADPSTDVINMARIRVAGVGGLGLLAMAGVVAWFVPRIGQTLAIGLVLGVVFAAVMILRRRRSGPMPSSGRRPGWERVGGPVGIRLTHRDGSTAAARIPAVRFPDRHVRILGRRRWSEACQEQRE